MKKTLFLICFALMITGCGFKQRPSWIIGGEQQLDSFKSNYLVDTDDLRAESHFKNAIEQIKKSGDLDLLEKAWLTRMSLHVAALKKIEEGDYREIANTKYVLENENYYKFLKGDISGVDIALLPKQYKKFSAAFLNGDVSKIGRAIASMKDEPVSQLIAAGIAVRSNIESEEIILTAVETASENGWKMALLTWMECLSAFYEAIGKAGKAADVRRRIELIR
jgi:hypothetical protein